MSGTEAAVLQKVRQWAQYADEDLPLARHALTLASACPHRLVAYHAQQGAEKYLKAYLVYIGIDFPYTHNVSRLLELCGDQAGWLETLRDAEELTPFAITTRYPGQDADVTREEALRAIEIAETVRETVAATLRGKGLTLTG